MALWLAGLMVIYIFSAGPVTRWAPAVGDAIYEPLRPVARSGALGDMLRSWIYLWGSGTPRWGLTRSYHLSAACCSNLSHTSLAKEVWAEEFGKTTNDVPTWLELRPYLNLDRSVNSAVWRNGRPICPRGGVYSIGRVGDPPKCSIGARENHVLWFDPSAK